MDGGKITGNTSVGDGGGVYADAADGNYQFRSTVNVKGAPRSPATKRVRRTTTSICPATARASPSAVIWTTPPISA